LILVTVIFSGCTDGNDGLSGKWLLVQIFGNEPNPNVTTTWEFFDNQTFLTQSVSPFEVSNLWQTYEVDGDVLHTVGISSDIQMDWRFKLSEGDTILSLMSLMQPETDNYTMVLEKI